MYQPIKALLFKALVANLPTYFELQDSNGNINAAFNSTGAQLTLGRIASSGTVTQGRLIFGDGTTDNFATTLLSATMTVGSRTITIPDTAGASASVCLTTGNCAGSGSGVTQSGTNAAGQISYFTSTNNISSNSLFYFDSTNTRLGIGTGSPSATLQLAGSQPASVGSGNGTAATAVLSTTGPKGGNTTATGGTNTGGAGSTVTITSGAGGDATGATGTNTGGTGGSLALAAGAGGTVGNNASATSGTGGAVTINSGAGGAGVGSSANGTGGAITIAAGAGGTGGSGSGGNGGAVTLQGGAGGSSTNGNGGDITLQGGAKAGSGTEGSVIIKPQSDNTAALKVQNAAGTLNILTADTTNKKIIIGNGSPVLGATTNGGLYVTDSAEFAGQILIGTTSNGVAIDATNKQVRFTGTARNDIVVALKPEFEGSTLRGDGSSNVGTMVSDICSDALNINDGGGANACDTGQAHTYYEWTTVETSPQDYDLYLRWKLPSDFDSSTGFDGNISINIFGWRTDSTNNAVTVNLYNDEGGVCGTADQAVASASATDWSTLSFAGMAGDADCEGTDDSSDIRAGEYVVLRFRMTADTNDIVRLGEVEITYKSQF